MTDHQVDRLVNAIRAVGFAISALGVTIAIGLLAVVLALD